MSNRTISDELDRFYSNQYISATVVRQQLFESETTALIDQLRSSMTNNFLLSLSMIRETTQANVLFSVLQKSYKQVVSPGKSIVGTVAVTYNNCSCASSSKCVRPISVFKDLNRTNYFKVIDFYEGCYVIESLLQSSLGCFYDHQCIDRLQLYFSSSSSIPTPALDASLFSRYFTNSTVQEIIDNLMIDQWNASPPIYERYYNECQPIQCTYKFQTRNDVIYIATTLFGIAGGLVTVLEIVVPRFIKLVTYCIRKRRTAVVPEVSVVQT